MENIQQMSMLEVAVKLMNDKKTKQPISKIIKEVLEMKGIDDPEGDYASQLYLDITTSSLFVYTSKCINKFFPYIFNIFVNIC